MSELNVSISEVSLSLLNELARWSGVSVQDALEAAIQDQYERKFWPAVEEGYSALRADPVAWAEVEQERRSLEGTLLDGLNSNEIWTENRDVIPSDNFLSVLAAVRDGSTMIKPEGLAESLRVARTAAKVRIVGVHPVEAEEPV